MIRLVLLKLAAKTTFTLASPPRCSKQDAHAWLLVRPCVRAFQSCRLDFRVINGRTDTAQPDLQRAWRICAQIKRNDANSILIYRRISRQCQFELQIRFAVWHLRIFPLSAPNQIYRRALHTPHTHRRCRAHMRIWKFDFWMSPLLYFLITWKNLGFKFILFVRMLHICYQCGLASFMFSNGL